MSSAARTARRASSSRRWARPKTAMTASPMNFSTIPPWCSRTPRSSSKARTVAERRAPASSLDDERAEQVREDDRQRPPAGQMRSAAPDRVAALRAPRPRRVGAHLDRRAARGAPAGGGLGAALDRGRRRRDADQPRGRGRRAIPERDRGQRLDDDRRSDRLDGRGGEQGLERGRHGLERGRELQGAPCHDPVAAAGFGEDDVARAHTRPVGQPDAPRPLEPVVQDGQGGLALGDGLDGAEGIRRPGDRQPEHGHHRVPDPLLDPAAVRLEHAPELVEVLVEDVPERLRVEALGERRGPLQVRNDHRHAVRALRRAAAGEADTAPRAVPPRRQDVTPARGAGHPLHVGGDRPSVGQLRITSRRDRRPAPCRRT